MYTVVYHWHGQYWLVRFAGDPPRLQYPDPCITAADWVDVAVFGTEIARWGDD